MFSTRNLQWFSNSYRNRLLKGTLLRNKNLKFINKDINIKVLNDKTKFTSKYKLNEILKINIAHNEGNYFTDSNHLEELEQNNLVAFKYCNEKGDIDEKSNPNGAINNIAGIFNSKKNILGMMPHPERMVDKIVSNKDGLNLFSSLLN
jgi:Phosphoribosylformylglycinamidine (FGAM) synthase, glutamine amidotransferase domain